VRPERIAIAGRIDETRQGERASEDTNLLTRHGGMRHMLTVPGTRKQIMTTQNQAHKKWPSASAAREPGNGLFAVLKSGSCELWRRCARVRGRLSETEWQALGLTLTKGP
jgi:hypothetical protein